jgi:hypothetical protein
MGDGVLRKDLRTEVMRRAGLFLGAAILGLWCADWLEYFSGASAAPGMAISSPTYALLFVAIGVLLAVVSHNWLLRAAWIVLAIQHGAVALSPIVRGWSPVWASSMLTGPFAVLLVVAGARRRTGQVRFAAAAVFVGPMVARIVVLTYAARVRSG